MESGFNSKFFADNRKRLRELYGKTAPIIITANGLLQHSGDTTFPFHQDANFWYLTGINEPDMLLVMYKDEEYLVAPKHTETQDIFDGSLDWKQLKQVSGIRSVVVGEEGWKRLSPTLKRVKQVATLEAAPAYIEQIGMYTNPARARLLTELRRVNSRLIIDDIRPYLASMRVIKQAPEIMAIRKAVDITSKAFMAVQKGQYGDEAQLEGHLTQLFRSSGAEGHAYTPIVAGGLNACTLHYIKNNERLRKDRLVLVDAGAQYHNYAADITRTWSIGRATSRQRHVMDAVNEALEVGISALKLGASFRDSELQVREHIGQKLKELRLIKRATKESIKQYYPHSPHYLGLDVHDVGDYNQPLEPGMVMTLEPGIYIPEEFIGVRIEENILMTEKGPEVLSAALPRLLG